VDVSTRKLRYFVAVAEELHFSRAASKLFVSQQVLSRQTKELEDALGTELLRRSTRSVELTHAGEVFLDSARRMLAALDEGVDAAQRIGRGRSGKLRVGFMIGAALELTGPILQTFAQHHPDVNVELCEYGFADTSAGLLDGSSDVAILRVPCAIPSLEFEPLFVEPLVAWVPREHPLASASSVSVQCLVDEPMVLSQTADPDWQRFWSLERYRSGSAPRISAWGHSLTEKAELVAYGAGISVTPASAHRGIVHRGIRFIPISDGEGSVVAIGWLQQNRTQLVDRFRASARTAVEHENKKRTRIEHPFDEIRT
jgi:DNA-binding transcriptional LysR family regulator